MALYSTELARREGEQIELRAEALRANWIFDDLVSADGHTLRVVFTCSIKALDEPAERKMLAEVFLAKTSVLTTEAVVSQFQAVLRAAAVAAAQKRAAAEWLEGDRKDLIEAIRAAGDRLGFSSGLQLLPPFQIDIESATLEQQRMEEMQRNLAEQRAAGQLMRFQRAAELLKQFEAIRQSAPQLTPGQVLRQLSPADQGMALQTLLLGAGKERMTDAVWAVAGMSLVRIDPRATPLATQVIELPANLGPMRSVQRGDQGTLLIGARSGVMVVDPQSPRDVKCYADPAVTSQLGFSRAVRWHDEIWACHSEAGIVAWKLGETERPMLAMRPVDLLGASPKNLQVLDEGQLAFSTQDRLITLVRKNADDEGGVVVRPITPDAAVEIVAILPERERVTVVLKNGVVQLRDPESLKVVREVRPCGEITTAAFLPWLGSTRVLLATKEGTVLCMGWEDDLVTQYLSPYRGLLALGSASDVIAGLSGDRQRIVLWNTWNASQPLGEVYVTAITHHRTGDVEV
ncbi:MAG: hypothetical protein ACM359_05315 [Bacillota bacterium]